MYTLRKVRTIKARTIGGECAGRHPGRERTTIATRMLKMDHQYTQNDVQRREASVESIQECNSQGGAEFQSQKSLNRSAGNWNKGFLRTTDKGLTRI
jgi:hypothetical protein